MLRIVLPVGISAAVSPAARWLIRRAVSAPDVVAVATANIRVTVEIIVVVDVDVVVAAPTASPAPAAAPKRPHHYANAKSDCHSRGVVSHRRVVNGRVRIDRRSVDHDGIIDRKSTRLNSSHVS